jgi:hypothetical protein
MRQVIAALALGLLSIHAQAQEAPQADQQPALTIAVNAWLAGAGNADLHFSTAIRSAPKDSPAQRLAQQLSDLYQANRSQALTDSLAALSAPQREDFKTAIGYAINGKDLEAQALFLQVALSCPEGSESRALARKFARAVELSLAPASPLAAPRDSMLPATPEEGNTTGAFSSVFLGAGLGIAGGIVANIDFGVEGDRAAIGIPLLTGAVGGLGGYAYHRFGHDGKLSADRTAPLVAGTTLGLGEGALLLGLVGELGDGENAISDNPEDVLFLSSLVGLGAGVAVAEMTQANQADSSAATTGAFWGTALAGLTLGVVANVDTKITPALAAGYHLGLAGGIGFAKTVNPSGRRVAAINGAGILGGIAGGGVTGLLFINSENVGRFASAGAALGSLGGLTAGYLLSRNSAKPAEASAEKPSALQLKSFSPSVAQGLTASDRPMVMSAGFAW